MTQTKITTPGITDTNITNAKLGTDISATKITADTLADARIPDLNASKITSGTLADARISASAVTQHVTSYDDNKLQSNVALLGFKTAVNGSLAKYNLQDQIIDEYTDATGVDASASTSELLTSGVYSGGTVGSAPTGGNTSSAGGYNYHYYLIGDTGENFVINNTTTVEFLLVGGGGQGGSGTSGGGGSGGLIYVASASLPAGTYAITIGAGGSGNTDAQGVGDAGSNSIISDGTRVFTALGGGAGGGYAGAYLQATDGGGSAGAHAGYNTSVTANNTAETPTSPFTALGGAITTGGVTHSNVAFGNNGGIQYQAGNGGAGGGGGAGGVGANGVAYDSAGGGNGGAGKAIASFNHTLWSGSSNTYYAAGGGGANFAEGNTSTNSIGGVSPASATGDGTDGVANTGSGGGGTWNHGNGDGGDGGSGVAVMRYTNADFGTVADLTLQSTDTTASTANPDYADMVMLIENASGTATLNTDIKGYISEDSGVTFTQGTLVDEGTWGTNKKILAFHDLDISAQTGSAMCYKITTHNQSAGVKETKIHATSIGWR